MDVAECEDELASTNCVLTMRSLYFIDPDGNLVEQSRYNFQ